MPTNLSIKQIAPSLHIEGRTATLSFADLEKLVQLAVENVAVDEKWYLAQNPDVAAAIKEGTVDSATSHFKDRGFLEGRLPSAPYVDEVWYLRTYPDIAEAIRNNQVKSALDHYVNTGMFEGRLPKRP